MRVRAATDWKGGFHEKDSLLAVALIVLVIPIGAASAEVERIENLPVCHVNQGNDAYVWDYMGTDIFVTFGKVMSVSPKATRAHVGHGDRVPPAPFNVFDDEVFTTEFFETIWGISLPNADCWFGVQIP